MARMTDIERCQKFNAAVGIYNEVISRMERCSCSGDSHFGRHLPEMVIESDAPSEYIPQNTEAYCYFDQNHTRGFVDISASDNFIDGTETSSLLRAINHLASEIDSWTAKPHGPLNKHFANGYIQLYDANNDKNGTAIDYVDNTCWQVSSDNYAALVPAPDTSEFFDNQSKHIWNTYDSDDEATKVTEALADLESIASDPVSAQSNTIRTFSYSISIIFSTYNSSNTLTRTQGIMRSAYTALLTKLNNAYTAFLSGQTPTINVSDIEYTDSDPTEYLQVTISGGLPSNAGSSVDYQIPYIEYTTRKHEALYWTNPNTGVAEQAPYTGYDFTTNQFWIETLGDETCSYAKLDSLSVVIPVWPNDWKIPVTVEGGVREQAGGGLSTSSGASKQFTTPKTVYTKNGSNNIMSVAAPVVAEYEIPACSEVPLYTIFGDNNPLTMLPQVPIEVINANWTVERFSSYWQFSQIYRCTYDNVTYSGYGITIDPEWHSKYFGDYKLLLYKPSDEEEE